MSRQAKSLWLGVALPLFLFAPDAVAQTAESAVGQAQDVYGPPPPMEDCSAEQEAAIVSGEIIVCRRKVDQDQYRVTDREAAQKRYAEENERMGEFGMPAGLPDDFVGPGIFRGPATVGGLCVIGPCPPPPAYMIDFDELPDTPTGSDAERVGQGLAPRGEGRNPEIEEGGEP